MKLDYPQFWQRDSVLCFLLIPFSWIFRLLGILRRVIIKPKRIGKFVVCVGNATVGGTGKTQVIKWLARYLQERQISFVIVVKGYGVKLKEATIVGANHLASEVGDEAIELREFGNVIVASKITEAKVFIKKFNPTIILVDDGLQNPSFIKDLVILTLDPVRGIGNGRIIPAGPLRETLENALSKSDLVITVGNVPITNYEIIQKIETAGLRNFKAKIEISANSANKAAVELGERCIAFCGLGNPDKFFNLLEENGYDLVEKVAFPDHHYYTKEELDRLCQQAEKYNCELITTKKDSVKIPNEYNVITLEVALEFAEHEEEFKKLLDEKIPKTA